MKTHHIYLDAAANTPLDPRVFRKMKPFLSKKFCGNSHAIHLAGIHALKAIEEARDNVAKTLKVTRDEVYFTSGATESNNWVIKSLALHELEESLGRPKKMDIVVSAIEHSSIINTCKDLERLGFHIIYVNPKANGSISVSSVISALTPSTLLVCVMAVNNETGVVNNIDAIAKVAHKNKSLMLSDCTQLFPWGGSSMAIGSRFPHVDYFTFSGHKIYGPTGTGCLIARKDVPLYSFMSGGAQEYGKRAGTSNTAGIVGLGEAVRLMGLRENESLHYKTLYSVLMDGITEMNKKGFTVKLNATPTYYNIVSINCSRCSFVDDLAGLLTLKRVDCSAGSACDAEMLLDDRPTPSHVLLAMGIPEREINNCIRISFMKDTTVSDIKNFITILTETCEEQRGGKR